MTTTRAEARCIVWMVDYASLGGDRIRRSRLAVFSLTGEQLVAQYHDEQWREAIETHGIVVAAGCFYPRDGRPFFENLSVAFSQCTLLHVDEEAPPARTVTVGTDTRGVDPSAGLGATGRHSLSSELP